MNQNIYPISNLKNDTDICEIPFRECLHYRVNADRKTCEIVGIGTCKGRNIIIPEMIDGYRVTEIGAEAFRGCAELTAVDIPDSVIVIKDSAFRGCTDLKAVKLPSFATAIGELAFSGCVKLERLAVPASVAWIGKAAFAGVGEVCVWDSNRHYRSVDGVLYTGDGKRLIHYAANKKETFFTVPDFVTSIDDWAFFGCMKLTDVTVGKSVESIGESAFRWCKSLQRVTIGNSVTGIGSEAFLGCENLVGITLGKSVKEICKDAFAFCMKLTSVTLPETVTVIGDRAFLNCESLVSVTVPGSVLSVGRGVFGRCRKLTDIRYAGTLSQWEKIVFQSDWKKGTAVREINFLATSNGLEISRGLEYRLNNDGDTCEIAGIGACKDRNIVIPEMIDGHKVTGIGASAFMDCSDLTGAVILESVTDIGEQAFCGCASLSTVTLGRLVANIGDQAFFRCDSLSEICYTGKKKEWKNIVFGKKWRSESSVRKVLCADKTVKFIF